MEKFCFPCRAALSALSVIGFRSDVMHCYNQQTGLTPVFLKDKFHEGEFFHNVKPVITTYNLEFQGVWDTRTIKHLIEPSDYYFALDKLEAYEDGNLLRDDVVYADVTTTVSNTYAEETRLLSYGGGLDGLMCSRAGGLRGIVNGIDYDEFNPETDTYITQTYNVKGLHREKVKDERAFQQKLGPPMDEEAFTVDIISRLANQKDSDLIQCVVDELCSDDLQLVVLGIGEEYYENMFHHYDWRYHDRISVQIYYSEAMSHEIYMASDAFLMPSLFESCGLSQLVALCCGMVPTVRETGGLKDTVEPYGEYKSTDMGFSFANYNAHGVLGSVHYAKYVYSSKRWKQNKAIDRVMTKDYSWQTSVTKYQELYDWLIEY